MRCVGRFSSLNALDVGGGKITDAGIAQLQNLKHIYDLRLRCNGMTDAGMAHLQRLRQLGYSTRERSAYRRRHGDAAKVSPACYLQTSQGSGDRRGIAEFHELSRSAKIWPFAANGSATKRSSI